MAKDTDAEALTRWFCTDVLRVFRNQRFFDKEGIFIGDGSYLFVPDNPNYENSVKLLFDENDHPVSLEQYKKLSDEGKIRCQWRRCYKMITLLHTNRALDFFIFVAVKVVGGNEHEWPIFYKLVKRFVEGAGKGVMKRLILDRGFLDGEAISRCKKDYGIDILIPGRSNMDIYGDAMALFRLPEVDWVCCKDPPAEMKEPARPRPKAVEKREKKRLYLLGQARRELNQMTPPRVRRQLLPSDNHIIVYWRNYYGLFTPLEFAGTIATLGERARKKIAEKSRRLRRELQGAMTNPRTP